MLTYLAQSTPDISGVPADFVKSFLIMTAFLAVLGGGVIWGRRGSKGNPISLESPVSVEATIKPAEIYAQQHELEKIQKHIDALTRENLREHEAVRKQVADSITAGSDRMERILTELSAMEGRMTKAMLHEVKDLHNRVNPLAEKVAAHETLLSWIQARLLAIWDGLMSHIATVAKNQSEDTRRLHSRIDDAMTRGVKAKS
jgi:hypothetical protein